MASMLRTIRRRAQGVMHYGRGGRGYLQSQDSQDLTEYQRQVNIRLNAFQPVKPKIIDNTSALKNNRHPRPVRSDVDEA